MSKRKPKPVGLFCSSCGHKQFKTINSRPMPGGIRRRKICMVCDQRVTTEEHITSVGRPRPKRDPAEVELTGADWMEGGGQ